MKTAIKKQAQLWQTTYSWLKACGNDPNSNYCKEEITTHPDYPSLLSVIDFLDGGGMAHKAVEADLSYINEFNYPLLAHTELLGNETLHIIYDATEWEKQKEITQYWSGVVVYPEKNSKWENEDNTIYLRNDIRNKIIASGLIIFGLSVFVFSTFRGFTTVSPKGLGFGLLSLLGLIISLFALGAELGFQSQIVKQVCGVVSSGGCEQVLQSRYARGFAGITPADGSIVYFASQFVIYLLACWNSFFLQSIFLFAYGGIAVAVWSIYTQAFKLKQWCVLCLGIVAVLISQSFITFDQSFTSFYRPGFTAFSCLILVFSFVLLPIKQLIKINSTNKLKLAELKKWKLDGELFIAQWQQEQLADSTIWQNDLLFGNPDAPIQITVACSLYCGPCAKAHVQLDNWLHRFAGNIKLQIRFSFILEEENNKLTIAAKAILQKAITIQNNTELQQMLTDWFKWMDYDKWAEKWQPDSSIDVSKRMKEHKEWIKRSNIPFTPTVFINGRKLPGRYSLADAEILMPQLIKSVREETIN